MATFIESLVPEVLCYIFSYIIPDYTTASLGRVHQDALVYSHVCRHWRRVALSDCTLWSRVTSLCIGMRGIRLFREMWGRSGDCTLAFDFSCCATSWGGYYDYEPRVSVMILWTILQHLPRVRHLNIAYLLRHKGLFTLNLRDAPQLRSLTCTLSSDKWNQGPDQSRELLLGSLPQLYTLDLIIMDLNWSWSLIKGNLTHLSITMGRFEHSLREDGSWNKLLGTLARSERLQTLVLIIALPPVRGSRTESRLHAIHLRHLHSIEINSHVDRIEALLDHLVMPDTVNYILRPTLPDGMAHAERDNPHYSYNFLRLLARFSNRLIGLDIDRVNRTDIYRSYQTVALTSESTKSTSTLEFWHYHPPKWTQKPVEGLSALYPFSKTVRLQLSGHHWHLSLAEGALLHFPRLEILDISGYKSYEYFFRVVNSSNAAAVLPTLVNIRELWLSGLTSHGSGSGTKYQYVRGSQILPLLQLISEKGGHNLPVLRIQQVVIDSQKRWVERIRAHVGRLESLD